MMKDLLSGLLQAHLMTALAVGLAVLVAFVGWMALIAMGLWLGYVEPLVN